MLRFPSVAELDLAVVFTAGAYGDSYDIVRKELALFRQVVNAGSAADALEKNQQVAEEVKKAAEDLSVAHAVLDTKAKDRVVDDETKRAVAETERSKSV